MVVGVNGVGKTTTIGKLAYQLKKKGFNVILGAADTFRAAAIEQLEIWSERVGVPIVKQKMGSDSASVAFDTLQSASTHVLKPTEGCQKQQKRNLNPFFVSQLAHQLFQTKFLIVLLLQHEKYPLLPK